MKKVDSKSPFQSGLQRSVSSRPFFSNAGKGGFEQPGNMAVPFFSQPPVQAKLKVHPSDDVFEKEADAMADKVVQGKQATAESGEESNGVQAFRNIQRQRAFESPTVLEQNHAAAAPENVNLQRKAEGDATEAPPRLESQLAASQGGGTPMGQETRSKMEGAFGQDFSDVKIHTGPDAAAMNNAIDARAFTHGNDIYFNEGEYQPATAKGEHLLAHELTHTIQQNGGVAKKKAIQKAGEGGGPKSRDKGVASIENGTKIITYPGTDKKLELTSSTLKGLGLSMPQGKEPRQSYYNGKELKYVLKKAEEEQQGGTAAEPEESKQVSNWKKEVKVEVDEKADEVLAKATPDSSGVYFFRLNEQADYHIIGTADAIKAQLYIPYWNVGGKRTPHHVDHIVEKQLGGVDDHTNYELLDAVVNTSCGSSIRIERNKRIAGAMSEFNSVNENSPGFFPDLPNLDAPATEITVFFKIDDWKLQTKGTFSNRWDLGQIKNGEHINKIGEMNDAEKKALGGSEKEVTLYVSARLGTPMKKAYDALKGEVKDFYPGLDYVSSDLQAIQNTENNGNITFRLNKDLSKRIQSPDITLQLIKLPNRKNTYYIKTTRAFTRSRFKGMSPVTVNEFYIDEKNGLVVTGTIEPDIDLLKGAYLDFLISKGDLQFTVVIPMGVIVKNFPKLFNVTNAFLMISYSTKKDQIDLSGMIRFRVDKLGEGEITAGTDGKAFKLTGKFIFDKSKFDGELRVGYHSEKGWSFGGTARIGAGKVKGVKDAVVNFDYAEGVIIVTGTANLTVPGLKTLKISANIGKDGDFVIVAEATLGEVTGLKGGNVTVIIASKKGEDLSFAVKGNAVPDFPGVPGLGANVTFSYDKGILDVRAVVDYNKGRFIGKLELGLTNRGVDEKGQLTGEPQDGKVLVFGYGELTVEIFKGVKGTIKARFTPDKKLLVAGEIGVNNIQPFGPGVNFHHKLFDFPSIKIPLVGIPGVSIFFEISGGAHFNFNWEPLVLQELTIGFREIDINEIDSAQVDIKGKIGSKALAEAYMEIKASLGAQVLVATIKGSLGGQAGIGVEGEVGGEMTATWNHEKGLQLKEILAYITVNPKAIFRLTGSVSVDLDLWLTTINLYYKEWVLAEGDADLSGLSLKVGVPIKFDENGNLIPPDDFSKLNVEQPNFSGEQGRAALDGGINGDAKKERKLAKDKLRADISRDMKASVNDDEFSPSEYAKSLQKKYADDPEMQTFILDSVNEEVKIQEYEEFENLKAELRKSDDPLEKKVARIMVFRMFRHQVSPGDIDGFTAELYALEQQKKAQPAAPQASGNS